MTKKHPDDPDVEYVPHGFDPDAFVNHYPLDEYRERVARGDMTAIIEAFVRAHSNRCYPAWLLHRVAQAFGAYYSKKTISLDDAIGLSPGRWTKSTLDTAHWHMARDLYLLTAGLGVPLNRAAELVESKLHARPAHVPGRSRSVRFDAETLKRKYTREWKRQFALDADPPVPPCYSGRTDPDRTPEQVRLDWRTFLATFPPESLERLPSTLRASLPLS
jgi:hypothetical protein